MYVALLAVFPETFVAYDRFQRQTAELAALLADYNTRLDVLTGRQTPDTAFGAVVEDLLHHVPDMPTHVVILDGTLIWTGIDMTGLIRQVADDVSVVAPKVVFRNTDLFADVWGYRIHGKHFRPLAPYAPGLDLYDLTMIESAGVCLAMRVRAALHATICLTDCSLVSMSRSLTYHGYPVYYDPIHEVHVA